MANPRRTSMTPVEGPSRFLALRTELNLRKGATFHSPPTSPIIDESCAFVPPSLPRRSNTNLDDVVGAHRRRAALTLADIDKSLAALEISPVPKNLLKDNSLPVPQGFLDHTVIMKKKDDGPIERRVLRPRATRRSARHHDSDSGLGSSLTPSGQKQAATVTSKRSTTMTSTITRSMAATSISGPGLSDRAANRIYEHTLKPLLAKSSLKPFHKLVLDCPRRIKEKEFVCLRDIEKALLLVAPEKTKVAGLYLDFCMTTIRCIQATVDYLGDRERTRPRDSPYTNGYFIDLVDQIRQYAQQLADAREQEKTGEAMEIDPTDEVKLHGGIHINGRPAELVRVKRNGKAISIATGQPVEIEEEANGPIRIKRSASEEIADEEELMRSMARRKKNASPDEYAPKGCREPGCNKMFKRPCDLTKHEKTHSRPWKCPIPTCKYHEYGWPTEKEMDRHQNDKHSAAPAMYECQYKPCPYKSKRESNCKQHMEKAHGWTYVRSKMNGGRKSVGEPATLQATPFTTGMPTPPSDHGMGIATPPGEGFPVYAPDLGYPQGLALVGIHLPQELYVDQSPIDNTTPSSSEESIFERSGSTYTDHTLPDVPFEDIYSANYMRIPTPTFTKEQAEQFVRFTEYELRRMSQPVATAPLVPHISPLGQGNSMLYTPQSLAEVDEGFEDYSGVAGNGTDYVLFPKTEASTTIFQAAQQPLFGETQIPSLAAGYSQPNSQDFMLANWNPGSSFESQ